MAFQRPFLISLKRGDSSLRWGFGIKGGKDYGETLTIQTVNEDSLAEHFGLHEGDEIIQVGRVNVQDLTLGQVYELLARCGNKIEMFVIREDLLLQRKGKEPQVVKAIVHNPYNSPLSLYSAENIADTLGKQTEVLTEGHISAEEDEGPENLSFKQKSAVFQLLEEQSKQEVVPKVFTRGVQQSAPVTKPKSAPPPPPKPKPPSHQHLSNGYDSPPPQSYQQQVYQDQNRSANRVEYQTTTSQRVVNQYQYQQEQPVQYQQTTVTQTRSPGYQSPKVENQYFSQYQQPIDNYQQQPSQQNKYQQSYQQNTFQQSQGYQSPTIRTQQASPGFQSPGISPHQQLNQSSYQQSQTQHHKTQSQQQTQQPSYQQQPSTYQQQQSQNTYQHQEQPTYKQPSQQRKQQQQTSQQLQTQQTSQKQQTQQSTHKQQTQQTSHQHQKAQEPETAVSRAEFKIGPPPPPRGASSKQESSEMAAVYKQQYEHHLQQQLLQQQQQMHLDDEESSRPRAHIIEGNIFEHNSSSGAPITYKAPHVAPPKPDWPPPPSQNDMWKPDPGSPTGMDVSSVWPPKRSTATDLPRTGFNPAAVRDAGNGRRCVWPPQREDGSGRNTPQSPATGRRIQWNPSPSPPLHRRAIGFSPAHSPARRKDIQWPPPGSEGLMNGKDSYMIASPRLSRKARFEDYVHEHASINVPQTYRPPPGTQHVEYH